MYTGAEALLQVLKQNGVKTVFSSPGSVMVHVWEALAKLRAQGDEGLRYFNCRHEVLAVSMAIGHAQSGSGTSFVLLHTSSGLLNASMAIRGAYITQTPMVVLSAESHHPQDVGGAARIAVPFVKWSQEITRREDLAPIVARACHIVRMSAPGPVFLATSVDILGEAIDEVLPQIPMPLESRLTNPSDIEGIASMLLRSHKPVLITERLGAQPLAVPKLVELAETLAAPVFETNRVEFANFPKEHPLHAGFDVSEALKEVDVILAVASATPWNAQMVAPRSDAKVIFLDSQALQPRLPYWNYRADMIVCADPLLALDALVERVKAGVDNRPERLSRLATWRAKHDALVAEWDNRARRASQQKPIDSHWLCYVVNQCLPEDAIVVEETVTQFNLINWLLRRTKPGGFYSYKHVTQALGEGMGVALGHRLASPERPVVYLAGDGAFNYNPVQAGLGFCQEYRLPIVVVLFNNAGYQSMGNLHRRTYPQGWASRTGNFYGVDIAPVPDYAQLAQAFGAYGERVEEPGEIAHALERAWAEARAGRAVLLDLVVDHVDPRK